jgi:hypothetical protein
MANPHVEHWFRLADEDRDGGVGGAEAVRFFTKSGLPQDVLGQVIGLHLKYQLYSCSTRCHAIQQHGVVVAVDPCC